jgi:hypothetical protein
MVVTSLREEEPFRLHSMDRKYLGFVSKSRLLLTYRIPEETRGSGSEEAAGTTRAGTDVTPWKPPPPEDAAQCLGEMGPFHLHLHPAHFPLCCPLLSLPPLLIFRIIPKAMFSSFVSVTFHLNPQC